MAAYRFLMSAIEVLSGPVIAAIEEVFPNDSMRAITMTERTVARLFGTEFATYDPVRYRGTGCPLLNWVAMIARRDALHDLEPLDLRPRLLNALEAVHRPKRPSTAPLVAVAEDAAERLCGANGEMVFRLALAALDGTSQPELRTTLAADVETVYTALYASSPNPYLDALEDLCTGTAAPILLEVLIKAIAGLRLCATE